MEDELARWKEIITPCFLEYPFGGPSESLDEEGRLHADEGPALVTATEAAWYSHGLRHGMSLKSDGSVDYYFRGILIPRSQNPLLLTPKTLYQIMEGFIQ